MTYPESLIGRHGRITGLPDGASASWLFYLPEHTTLVCCCDFPHAGTQLCRLYYRSVQNDHYAPLIPLDGTDSITGVVVDEASSLIVASIVTYKQLPDGLWAGFEVGLVRIQITTGTPQLAPLVPPFDSCSQLVSLSPSGEHLYCVARSERQLPEGGIAMDYNLVRWELESSIVEVVCPMPGIDR